MRECVDRVRSAECRVQNNYDILIGGIDNCEYVWNA